MWYAAQYPDSNLQVLDIRLAGDVNADGWDDLSFLVNIARSGGRGTAIRALGGPRYPDEMGQRLGIDGEPGRPAPSGVRIWPQPATDWLHVAWGDGLAAHPAVIVVHDGREVMRQEVGESQRDALLRCGDLGQGAYVLGLYHGGILLSSATFVR